MLPSLLRRLALIIPTSVLWIEHSYSLSLGGRGEVETDVMLPLEVKNGGAGEGCVWMAISHCCITMTMCRDDKAGESSHSSPFPSALCSRGC